MRCTQVIEPSDPNTWTDTICACLLILLTISFGQTLVVYLDFRAYNGLKKVTLIRGLTTTCVNEEWEADTSFDIFVSVNRS